MQSIGIRHVAAAAVFVALTTNWSSTLAAQSSPSLTFSTYLGGPGEDRAGGVAVDAQGNIYVAGMTNGDVFVMKLSPAGDQVIYKTILGGSGYEEPSGIAVDGAGNA
jgi:DNA-binding beta-propeller fold protein YncE